MPRPLRIAPSILAADFARLGEEVKAVELAGADLIHVDVMDGHFVPNITLGPAIVKAIKKSTTVPLDLHLMIAEPDRYLEEFARAGGDLINVHVETVPDLPKTVAHIRALGKKAAVAVRPATPMEVVLPVLADLDMVLLMTVNPGFSGQKFMDEVVPKIVALRAEIERRNLDVDIQVDGGINPTTVATVVEAGANVLVAGNAIFGQRDRGAAMRDIRARAAGG